MDDSKYWDSLTDAQKQSFRDNMDKADELGVDITIVDAIDIWYMIDKNIRGERPEE